MSHRRITVVSSIVSAALAATAVLLLPRHAGEPTRTLAQPDYLAPEARAALRRHMHHHGTDLLELQWDVLLLDDEAAAAAAERIAREPALPRVDEKLPERFFAQQNEMLASAVRLAEAARAHDGPMVAQAYGRLAASCVACHRAYLRR